MELLSEVEEKIKNEAQLAVEQERLVQHGIRSPVDGVVRKVVAEPGQTVSPGTPVIEVVDLSSLKAEFFLPVVWYGRLRVGEEYLLDAGEPVNRKLAARLESADRVLDSASQTFRAVFRIPNPRGRLAAGFQLSFSQERVRGGGR